MSEDIIWNTISKKCCFQAKTITNLFCRNINNVNGLCSKETCPILPNNYATIREENGIIYLYKKLVENVEFQNRWEKIKLKTNEAEALNQIEQHLIYWPNFRLKKVKSRFEVIRKMVKRKRKMANDETLEIASKSRKFERLENRKEIKSLKASKIKSSIDNKVLEKLMKKNSEFLNVAESAFNKHLVDNAEMADELFDEEEEMELVDEYISESDVDIEDAPQLVEPIKRKKSKAKPKIVVGEYSDDE